ncbi:hypothetical protein EDD29_3443 [Actinocorallia herbida]|uniref:Uncharacterized protein n=1 Tax=Actinocorallia herbida TaxID=58109 RepID=A0A3N1CX59_9ACTN|nr:hypothetical protein [Actinocorallia herbida]ROO85889.1 hypothetical protein EDD29_3443 [Actinocorallia herbida]
MAWGVLFGVPLAFGALFVSATSAGAPTKPDGERSLVLTAPAVLGPDGAGAAALGR